MVTTIIKRDGRTAEFNQEKIAEAVEKAFQACGAMQDRAAAEGIAQPVSYTHLDVYKRQDYGIDFRDIVK